MSHIEEIISNAAQLGALEALRLTGAASGEVSQREAVRRFGSWFVQMERAGKITPVRIGEGPHGKRSYALTDILKLKTAQAVKAELINNQKTL